MNIVKHPLSAKPSPRRLARPAMTCVILSNRREP
jgi:hypothetical protein